MNPKPVVWASVYPEDAADFPNLKLALGRLKLSDSAFSYEEEASGTLGKGFRCGFLGMLQEKIFPLKKGVPQKFQVILKMSITLHLM
jgi:GTP-binding protein LepA